MKKIKLVIFEGGDKVGKTTLYQAYRRATKYGPLCIDRFIGSNIVHDQIMGRYKRREENEKLLLAEESLVSNKYFEIYLVVLICETGILRKRILREEENSKDREIAYGIALKAMLGFQDYFEKSKIQNKITINTSSRSIEECVKILLEFTGENNGL